MPTLQALLAVCDKINQSIKQIHRDVGRNSETYCASSQVGAASQ